MYRDKHLRCLTCAADLEQFDQRSKWRCPRCLGVLLASDEHAAELGPVGEVLASELETERLDDRARCCPVCDGGMNQLKIDGIVIERCPADRMLWFDAGELGKLRAAIAKREPTPLVKIWELYFEKDV